MATAMQHSNRKCLLTFVALFLILEQLPGLVFFNQTARDTPAGTVIIVCTVTNTAFIQFNNYFNYLLLGNVVPYAFTFSFGLMAYHNVQQLPYRTVPLVRRELDKQLTVMVLVQVVYNFVTLLPNLIVYIVNSYGYISDPVTKAQVNLAQTVTTCFYYAYFAVCDRIFDDDDERPLHFCDSFRAPSISISACRKDSDDNYSTFSSKFTSTHGVSNESVPNDPRHNYREPPVVLT